MNFGKDTILKCISRGLHDLEECQRQCGKENLRQNLIWKGCLDLFSERLNFAQYVVCWGLPLKIRNNKTLEGKLLSPSIITR